MGLFDDFTHVVTAVAKVANPVNIIGAAVDPVGTAVGAVGETAGNVVSAATGHKSPTQAIFDSVALAGSAHLVQAAGLLQAVPHAVLYSTLHSQAQGKIGVYEDLIREFVAAAGNFSSLASVLTAHNSAEAQRAIKAAIDKSPGVKNEMSRLARSDLISLSFEVGGQADLIVGADGAVGYAVGVPDILDATLYATVGLSAGAEEGGDAGVAVGISVQGPQDQSGPFISAVIQVDAALGGGIAVSFNLPDLSFSGVSVAIEAGEEVQIAASGGYTWVLH